MQLLAFAARVERLGEAQGARMGVVGQGPGLRLLIVGDSSAAGVGVARQEDALAGHVIRHLAPHFTLDWRLVARSGVTTAAARQMLDGTGQFDAAITALGVNDVLRQCSAARFAREQAGLMAELRGRHGVAHIFASAVPPLGAFEVFPHALRAHLGARAQALDAALQQVCAESGAQHVPFDLAPGPEWLARDGLHPGAPLYAEWGARMAGLVSRALS